MKATLNAAEHS